MMGFSNTFENYIGSDIFQWKNEKQKNKKSWDRQKTGQR